MSKQDFVNIQNLSEDTASLSHPNGSGVRETPKQRVA